MLKFFSILLFTFGLVAPVIASGANVRTEDQTDTNPDLVGIVHHAQFAQLLFEETSGEEEREFKAHKASHSFAPYFAPYKGVFDVAFNSSTIGYSSRPIHKLRADSSLFRLYRTLII